MSPFLSLPLEETGHTTTPTAAIRGQHTPRRGHRGFRGYSRGRRRARGRVGNFGNRLSSSAKLKEVSNYNIMIIPHSI